LSNELRQLTAALRTKNGSQLQPMNSEITIIDPGAVLGDLRAEVVLVEFADYNCTFCRRFFEETFPRIKEEYVDTGKVRYMFSDFPLGSVHPTAALAAEAAHCAAEQGAFWPMHDWLMRNSAELNHQMLGVQAEALGLDASVFLECLTLRKHSPLVGEEMSEGIQAGIKGTPTFFLGRAEPNGRKVKIERTIQGAPPFSFFKQNLNDLLERRAKTPGALTSNN
jgi:protein-disulfide isomerase